MEEIINYIKSVLKEATGLDDIPLEKPPRPEMGDYAFPCFMLSKKFKLSPVTAAIQMLDKIKDKFDEKIIVKAEGPYLNFFVNKGFMAKNVITTILKQKENYGSSRRSDSLVLIESPGQNTNKPLHLGHLRNMLLGKTISRILQFYGKKTKIVNVVNDRGVHICKSMLAYQMFGKGKTPEKSGKKSDHFVGDYYVKYAEAAEKNPEIEKEIEKMLVKWEDGDKETIALWKKMNKWAIDGFNETYKKLDFVIEKDYFESDSYKHGKNIILDALQQGIFSKNDDGAIYVDLDKKGLGKKVLLRANGTSVYITQDIYMAWKRHEDYNFDEMIYLVGNEQEYHFKVLFEVFKKLGWDFADKCFHFSYGMVELPEGKMKSREGKVIDADELIDNVTKAAKSEVEARYPDLSKKEINSRAEIIGKGAMRFFMLKFDPLKNFVFDLKESLSFDGETGPYVQYAYARISSIFNKLDSEIDYEGVKYSLLDTEEDRKLLTLLNSYRDTVDDAAKNLKPSAIAHYLINIASAFSEYYHANPILKADEELRNARLALIDCVRTVINSGLALLDIDVLEQM